MSEFVVYKKIICIECHGEGIEKPGTYDNTLCPHCKGEGTELLQVDLVDAIDEIIKNRELSITYLEAL